MHDPKDVVSLMLWIHSLSEVGDVYPMSGGIIWRRAGTDNQFFWCQDFDVYPLNIKAS